MTWPGRVSDSNIQHGVFLGAIELRKGIALVELHAEHASSPLVKAEREHTVLNALCISGG